MGKHKKYAPYHSTEIIQPKYPTDRYGYSIPLEELDGVPETRLHGKHYEETNHHYGFIKSVMARSVILLTFRNLDCEQIQPPIDVHQWLHCRFGPPERIKEINALDMIMEQVAIGGLIRLGSARHPEYKEITPEKIDLLKACYQH